MSSSADLPNDSRLLATLQDLLAIEEPELRPALNRASTLVAEALNAEKVDIFLYTPENQTLEALGTSDTLLGHLQHELGLERMAVANGGPVVEVFQSGGAYLTGRADLDPSQPRGVVDGLRVRSQIDVVLEVGAQRRGVLAVVSRSVNRFTKQDVEFLQAVSHWIGLITHRAEQFEARERAAVARGRRQAGEELALLTSRLREVAACLAEGLTNEEIAVRLVLSPGTVANHLQAIMNRLGMHNRVQVAVWAVESGLYRSEHRRLEDDQTVLFEPATANGLEAPTA